MQQATLNSQHTCFAKKLARRFFKLSAALMLLMAGLAQAYDRIVVLSPDVSDVVVALGAADKVVGKNAIDTDPALKHAKVIGMHRNLTPEPIVALKPDLAIGSYMVLPVSLYGRLNALNIKAVNVSPEESVVSYGKSIVTIGDLLGKQDKANALSSTWLQNMHPRPKTNVRYLLSYDGRIVAGKGTVGDELIKLAGGINAAANINGLKPLSREGWLSANADVIIVADHHKAALGELSQFKNRPEIKANPASRTGKVYYWAAGDFLTFGLNSPQVVDKLHGAAK